MSKSVVGFVIINLLTAILLLLVFRDLIAGDYAQLSFNLAVAIGAFAYSLTPEIFLPPFKQRASIGKHTVALQKMLTRAAVVLYVVGAVVAYSSELAKII